MSEFDDLMPCILDFENRMYTTFQNSPSVSCRDIKFNISFNMLAALAQMLAFLPLVQQVRGSIPGGVVNFHLKIFNFGARRGGDVHFLITRLYITSLD